MTKLFIFLFIFYFIFFFVGGGQIFIQIYEKKNQFFGNFVTERPFFVCVKSHFSPKDPSLGSGEVQYVDIDLGDIYQSTVAVLGGSDEGAWEGPFYPSWVINPKGSERVLF